MDSNFQQIEEITRQQSSYEQLVLDYFTSYVDGEVGNALTAAEETIAGLWARALGSARVRPETPLTKLITTEVLQSIGREFIRAGESLWTLDMRAMRLIQASHWDTHGVTADPMGWTYRIDVQAPDAQISRHENAAGVLHFRHAPRPEQPWVGVSPLSASETTRQLLRQLEAKLSEEIATTVGQIIPVPSTQQTQTAGLQAQLRELKGKIVLVPSTSSGWGEGRQSAPPRDWQKTRLGADPPSALMDLRSKVTMSLAHAAGIPTAVLAGDSDVGSREAWRQFLHGTIAPLGEIIEEELRLKLAPDITLDFENLFASDVQGRARAFGSLVQAGMPPAMAAKFTGFSENGESRDTALGRVRLPSADPG